MRADGIVCRIPSVVPRRACPIVLSVRDNASWVLGVQLRRTVCNYARRPARQPAVLRPLLEWRRGAKTSSTVKVKDLPQGVLKLASYDDGVDAGPRYPTVLQGHWNHMQRFKNCVVLTRVGGFYELYFEQAEELAPLLNIKLASKRTSAGPVPMAGFPFFQLDRYLKTLVEDLNKSVAISEEFAVGRDEKALAGGLQFERRVVRVITPGTLIDEKFIDPSQNNFILAVYLPLEHAAAGQSRSSADGAAACQHLLSSTSLTVGLSWLDLSTGDFFTQKTSVQMLASALTRIGAREVLVDQKVRDTFGSELQLLVGSEHRLLTFFEFPQEIAPMSEWNPVLEEPVPVAVQNSSSPEEVAAGYSLLEYVRVQLQGLNMKLQPPRRRQLDECMAIDRSSLRGLEILETSRDGFGKGSLLHAVRRTCTKSGARLLRDRLTSPSTCLGLINERLDLVSIFFYDPALRDDITYLLKQSYDAQRLVQKFTLGKGDPDDLICLSRAINASKDVMRVLSTSKYVTAGGHVSVPDAAGAGHSLLALTSRVNLDGPSKLAERIVAAIDEEGLLQKQRNEDTTAAEASSLAQEVVTNEGIPEELENLPRKVKSRSLEREAMPSDTDLGDMDTWIMKKDASPRLRQLHEQLELLFQRKAALTQRLRKAVGSSALTLKWTPGLGHICHVKAAKITQASLEQLGVTRNVSATKSTRSFYLPEWSELGRHIDSAKHDIRLEEQSIFEALRKAVILNLVRIRRNAAAMDELDVACSFAALAEAQGMVRPKLNNGTSHTIIGGRHPTVKLGLEEQGRGFVSNDCLLGSSERIWLITGPNMAGKSTFLRQNAVITILAQAGSFVPAAYAEIGIVDQIFSRIGAADDLFRDQSTFMVEMLETAAILRQATPRSFVIMDEVGRGTAPDDGTAVSFACLHHLHEHNKCRTLFATHFHVLADMTGDFGRLGRYCTDVKETASGSFSFVHRLRKGVNRESHALKVARLAGLPMEAIQVAARVQQQLKQSRSQSQQRPCPAESAGNALTAAS